MSTFFLKLQLSEIFQCKILALLFVLCIFQMKIRFIWMIHKTIPRSPLHPVRKQASDLLLSTGPAISREQKRNHSANLSSEVTLALLCIK